MSIQISNFQGIYGGMTLSQKKYNNKHSEILLNKLGSSSDDNFQSTKMRRGLSTYDAYIFMKNSSSKLKNDDYIVEKDIEDLSKWKEHFGKKVFEYEKKLLDDESKVVADEQESETKTDIVVNPDGSRVLVVAINVGGMETTMSLEISKPTNELNDTRNKNALTHEQAVVNADDLSEDLDSHTSV